MEFLVGAVFPFCSSFNAMPRILSANEGVGRGDGIRSGCVIEAVDFLEESLRDDDGLIGLEILELLMLFTED